MNCGNTGWKTGWQILNFFTLSQACQDDKFMKYCELFRNCCNGSYTSSKDLTDKLQRYQSLTESGGKYLGCLKLLWLVCVTLEWQIFFFHDEESSVHVSEIRKDLSTHSCVISSEFFVTVIFSRQYVCQLEWILRKFATSRDKNFDSSFWKSRGGDENYIWFLWVSYFVCIRGYVT